MSLLYLLLVLGITVGANAGSPEAERRLHEHLLGSYTNRFVIPINGTQKVSFGLSVIGLDVGKYTGSSAEVEIRSWRKYMWTDSFLKWDPKDYDDIANTRLSITSMWRPDIKNYNSRDIIEEVDFSEFSMAVVNHDGNVLYIPNSIERIPCVRNGRMSFECKLIFGSWTYDGYHLDLDFYEGIKKLSLDNMFAAGDYNITKNVAERVSTVYECCPEPYVSLVYSFIVTR